MSFSPAESHEWSRISNLLSLLADGEYHSGEELGDNLGISRAAIWKYIKRIEDWGLPLESVKGKGYRLLNPVELLDEKKIRSSLSDTVLQQLSKIILFPEIDSTNAFLLQQPQIAAKVCLAEKQTGGRGRRGRVWISPFAQNIYFSLGWRFVSGIGALKGLSLLVGCAIVRVLKQLGFNLPGLKWPNDVLAEGKKLAGVLVEIRGDLSGDCELVIGIGLNYHMQDIYSDSISQPWIDLHELSQIESVDLPSRNELVAKIIQELFDILDSYEEKTFNAYSAEWESYNLYHNKYVSLTTGESVLTGKCLGVDAEGAIIVEDDNKQLHCLHGGEVSLRSIK